MNILILNGSPKRRGGASRAFSRLVRLMLLGCRVSTCSVRGPGDYQKALPLLAKADAVLVSSPLYVDGIPAHMLAFLERAEQMCREKGCRFTLYVMSNSGFIEARQNTLHLRMYEAFCERAGVAWGGGLSLGGGVMLHVLYILFPISVILRLVQILLVAVPAGGISGAALWAYASGLLVTPILFSLPLAGMMMLAHALRTGKTRKNLYVRPLIPSFLFLVVADIFMLLSALLKGTLPHRLFWRVPPQAVVYPDDTQ